MSIRVKSLALTYVERRSLFIAKTHLSKENTQKSVFSSFCVVFISLHNLCLPLFSRFCNPDFFYIPFFIILLLQYIENFDIID